MIAYVLLLSVVQSVNAAAAASSECVPKEMPNMVIDITNAVAKGARFTDPIKTASEEECVSECCKKLNSVGDQTCNLAVYDNRNQNSLQNCYLFLCPELESCPMSSSPGVLSYSFWTGKVKSNVDSTVEEIPKSKNSGIVQNSLSKKSSPNIQKNVPSKPEFEEEVNQHEDKKSSPSDHAQNKTSEVKHLTKEDNRNTPERITSKLLHLANNMDKQLEKIEASSKNAKDSESLELSESHTDEKLLVDPSSRYNDSKKLSSETKDTKPIAKTPESLEVHFPTPKLSTSTPSIRMLPQASTASHRPGSQNRPTIIPSIAPPVESKINKKPPSSGTQGTNALSSHDSSSSSRTATTVKNLILTTQVPTTRAAKSTLRDDGHSFANKDLQEADRSVPGLTSSEWQKPTSRDTKGDARNLNALATKPGDSDKSGLIAALVFGVMFLVLIIGLVSHKVSEARRRHQYTKLDYLINGMYVDT